MKTMKIIAFPFLMFSAATVADTILTNTYTGVGVDDSLACANYSATNNTCTDAYHYETIYNPFVIYDQQQGVYKMWYAGWEDGVTDRRDRIYYRTSSNGATGWSARSLVFSPDTASRHVNQPSVMKHWNYVTNQWQYSMFYEVEKYDGNHEIWSVVSSNGVDWYSPIKLRNASDDACDLSIVPAKDGYNIYQVVFAGKGGSTQCGDRFSGKIYRTKVDGMRTSHTSADVIYTLPTYLKADGGIVANPHAAFVNGKWQLWFNRYYGPVGNGWTDIYKVTCTTLANGELGICNGATEPILVAPRTGVPGEPCITATPGVIEAPGTPSQYRLYQSLDYRDADGVCRWYPQYMIHMDVAD